MKIFTSASLIPFAIAWLLLCDSNHGQDTSDSEEDGADEVESVEENDDSVPIQQDPWEWYYNYLGQLQAEVGNILKIQIFYISRFPKAKCQGISS